MKGKERCKTKAVPNGRLDEEQDGEEQCGDLLGGDEFDVGLAADADAGAGVAPVS